MIRAVRAIQKSLMTVSIADRANAALPPDQLLPLFLSGQTAAHSHKLRLGEGDAAALLAILLLLQQRLAIERSIFVQYFPGRVAA